MVIGSMCDDVCSVAPGVRAYAACTRDDVRRGLPIALVDALGVTATPAYGVLAKPAFVDMCVVVGGNAWDRASDVELALRNGLHTTADVPVGNAEVMHLLDSVAMWHGVLLRACGDEHTECPALLVGARDADPARSMVCVDPMHDAESDAGWNWNWNWNGADEETEDVVHWTACAAAHIALSLPKAHFPRHGWVDNRTGRTFVGASNMSPCDRWRGVHCGGQAYAWVQTRTGEEESRRWRGETVTSASRSHPGVKRLVNQLVADVQARNMCRLRGEQVPDRTAQQTSDAHAVADQLASTAARWGDCASAHGGGAPPPAVLYMREALERMGGWERAVRVYWTLSARWPSETSRVRIAMAMIRPVARVAQPCAHFGEDALVLPPHVLPDDHLLGAVPDSVSGDTPSAATALWRILWRNAEAHNVPDEWLHALRFSQCRAWLMADVGRDRMESVEDWALLARARWLSTIDYDEAWWVPPPPQHRADAERMAHALVNGVFPTAIVW